MSSSNSKNLNDAKFLIVDDFSTVRDILKFYLGKMGIANIVSANNGKEAWEKLQEMKATNPPDFIICDHDMPEMDGLEFLKLCKADLEFAKIPFLMLTGENTRETILTTLKSGVDGYILKPVAKQTLEDKIQAVWQTVHNKVA